MASVREIGEDAPPEPQESRPMTPTEILAALGRPGPLPRAAMAEAGRAREAMVPLFLDEIARLQAADADDAAAAVSFLFIFFLLGEWRETSAYRPLLQILRREGDIPEILLGYALTENAAQVIAGVFDGDPEPLYALIADPRPDGFVRVAMFETLVMVTLDGRLPRPEAERFLTDFPGLLTPDTGEEVWWAWAEAVAALGVGALMPTVEAVFDRGLIDPMLGSFRHIEDFLAQTLREGRPDWFLEGSSHDPLTDAVATLSTWHGFQPKPQAVVTASGFVPRAPQAAKVGRNDPCPCGSGLKYKKCCLA
jgi:hypothetical protein